MRGALAVIAALGAIVAAACIMIYAVEIGPTDPGAMSRAHFDVAGPMQGNAHEDVLASRTSIMLESQDVHLPISGLVPVVAKAGGG
ncbi:MAG: hypothetical protein RIB84_10455 [Sneathiellaceae bacterium]